MTLVKACSIMGVDPKYVTWQQIRDLYKELAKTTHPDSGGDRRDWDVLQEVYSTLKLAFSVPLTCKACGGEKTTLKRIGRKTIVSKCEVCEGFGTLPSPVTGAR